MTDRTKDFPEYSDNVLDALKALRREKAAIEDRIHEYKALISFGESLASMEKRLDAIEKLLPTPRADAPSVTHG